MDLSPGGADRAGTGLARPAGSASFSRHRARRSGPRRLPILPGNRRDMHGVARGILGRNEGMPQARSCHAVAARRPQTQGVYCAYTAFEACTCLLPLLSAKREARVAEGFPASYRVKHSSR
ncbi:hypothetical protein L493_3546 [Bordetella bronchiseptica 99-R-0433]|nr:hypothetical protein L493_3546 [Bordetella bronchiseptica 99-R-0433]